MALSNRNTLNDANHNDPNLTRATRREDEYALPAGPEYDHVLSTFKKIMKDDTAAEKFAYALYQIAAATEINVIQLLDSLDITNEMTLNNSMAYYLNSLNSPSTLYGVQNSITPSYYAGRNVLS